jgi:hypothetical protein
MKQAPTQRKTASTEVQPRRKGSALAVASFASYDAATPDKTRQLSNRIGTNPNSAYAQQQRVMMMWQAEDLVKNSDWISYCYALKQYCQPTSWISESPDPVLANEVTDYMRQVMKRGGINCSAMKAFSDAAHVEMPVRGDSILEAYFDESQLRFILRCADQIGELYRFINPASYGWAYGADAFNAPGLTDVNYFAGIFLSPSGENQAFKIYERGYNQMYINPHVVPAANCIYFQDNLFAGHRGVTKFAPAIQSIQKRNKIWQSGMDSMAMQSKIAAIASNSSGEPEEPAYETTTNDDGSISYIEKMSDGAVVKYQFTGDSYQFMKSEQPGGSLLQGLDYADERTCLALGFPKSMLITARDGGGAPTRFDMSRAGREIMRLRDEVYTPPLEKMAYLFIMDGINRGLLPAQAGVLKGRWHFPSLPTADAFRDDKSDVEAMRAGLTTRTAIIAKNGDGTFADVLKQGAQEAVAIQIATQDANRELVKRGYKPAIADLNIAQDTSNPSQQPQGEAPANATAAMAFDEGKHPRADDGKFGSGGANGKAEEIGEGADSKQKPVSQMSKGELKTHNLKKKLESMKAANAARAEDLAAAQGRVSEAHERLVEQLKSKDTSNDDLKKTVSDLGAKLQAVETHTATIRHALRGEDIAADEKGYDSPEHNAARKRTEYVAKLEAFEESKHPRSDDGKFGSGNDASAHADKKSKEAHVADKGRDRGLSQRMHRDAADAHDQAAKQYSEEGKRDYSEYHEEKATEHRQFSSVDAKEKRASAALAFDEGKHPRSDDGEFGSKGGGAGKKKDATAKKEKTNRPLPSKKTPQCDERCQRAKAAHVMVDKTIQRYAEEHNEPRVAKELGGISFPNSEPIDIAIAGDDGVLKHGIELKTMVKNANGKITMKGDAIARKKSWERKNKAQIHTLVIDDSAVMNAKGEGKHDESKRKIYYANGYGSFRIGSLHEVKGGWNEVKTLMNTPYKKLPLGAQKR